MRKHRRETLVASSFLALGALALVGCASGHKVTGPVVVNARGRIGPLRLNESNRAKVISFAGRPDSERHGRYLNTYDALGYGCRGRPAVDKVGLPRCRTVFYLDGRTGKLEILYTVDQRYVDPHGVHVGTPTPIAQRRLHRRPFNGCYSGFRFDTKSAFLVMWLEGGKKLVGNHVGFLVVHSERLNPGVFDCIDS